MNKGIMIAVCGSKGCGKTTTSVKLAVKLAELKKEVILVLTDITAPDINVLLPAEKNINSMGNIWAIPDCSVDVINKACTTTKSNYIGILSYKNGENIFSNPDYTKENIMDIFMKIKNMADYVIVDCVDAFAYNVLSTVALELSDKVIRMGEPTLKSFSYFDSNMKLLMDSRYKSSQHFKVLSKIKSYQAKDIAVSHLGEIQAELPYVEALEKEMLEGELFSLSDTKPMKSYYAGLQFLMDYIDDTVTNTLPEAEDAKKEDTTRKEPPVLKNPFSKLNFKRKRKEDSE